MLEEISQDCAQQGCCAQAPRDGFMAGLEKSPPASRPCLLNGTLTHTIRGRPIETNLLANSLLTVFWVSACQPGRACRSLYRHQNVAEYPFKEVLAQDFGSGPCVVVTPAKQQ